MTSSARKFAIYRQWSRRHFYERGVQHFLIGLRTPNRMGTGYPTRDKYSATDEADFIAGWTDEKTAHDLRKIEANSEGSFN